MLTVSEKETYGTLLAGKLPVIRKILGTNQKEFGELCGYSRVRISLIENSREKMSWSQFTSFYFVISQNPAAYRYALSAGLWDEKLDCFFHTEEKLHESRRGRRIKNK